MARGHQPHPALARRPSTTREHQCLTSQRNPHAQEPEAPGTAVLIPIGLNPLTLPVERLMVATGIIDAALIPWPLIPATLIRSSPITIPVAVVALTIGSPALPRVRGRRAQTGSQRKGRQAVTHTCERPDECGETTWHAASQRIRRQPNRDPPIAFG
jgi:hypothetical protein